MAFGGGFDMGASQFAGGGFMPSPAGGHDAGMGGGNQKSNSNRQQTVRHVTLKQVLRDNSASSSDEFHVDGTEVAMITFVGRILSVQEQATRILLKVNDGTGTIEVQNWVNDADEQVMARTRADLQVGRYVRVYGNLKRFNSSLSVSAYTVRPVTDFNEITYQALQVIYQHLHITKGAPPAGGPAPPSAGPRPQSYAAPAPVAHAAHAAGPTGPYDLNAEVLKCFADGAANAGDGFTAHDVVGALGARGIKGASFPAVREALTYLANEGQLYTTSDEDHYKPCN